jgi:DNA-binding NtrC family response regulator
MRCSAPFVEPTSQAKNLAQSDSSVLLLGEVGSGKETIARAIHRVSRRRNESFVKINCRTGTTELQESTFFGQQDGSSAKSGRIELANRGTLFLDEVARIPLDMQPKVLRTLTHGEIERVGSARTLRINVRRIFASRYDLEKRVAEGQFHESLYHQITTSSIMIPADSLFRPEVRPPQEQARGDDSNRNHGCSSEV